MLFIVKSHSKYELCELIHSFGIKCVLKFSYTSRSGNGANSAL
jgi:hypothetical protein